MRPATSALPPAALLFLAAALGLAACSSGSGGNAEEAPAQEFAWYWGVTSERGGPHAAPGYVMDTEIDVAGLPLSRSAVVFYGNAYGLFPRPGLHAFFYDAAGGLGGWEARYEASMDAHLASLEEPTRNLIGSLGVPEEQVVATIDYERWWPVWEMFSDRGEAAPGDDPLSEDEDFRADWIDMVAALNTSAFDASFLARIEHSPPPGATGWDDLDADEQENLSAAAWHHFSRDFYLRTLRRAREAAPSAKWGFWNMPFPIASPHPDSVVEAANESLSWLWAEVDVFLPSMYAVRYATDVPEDAPSDCKTLTPEANQDSLDTNISHFLDLRDRHATPGRPIAVVPYLWWHFASRAGQDCSRSRVYISDTNLIQALTTVREAGADGAVIWGAISDRSTETYITEVGEELRDRWAALMGR